MPIWSNQSDQPLKDFNVFAEEGFSGADANFYFGNIWVDDIVSLDYRIMEQTKPLYGYASYTVDAWAHGNRLVEGSFRVPFTEAYKMRSILDQIEADAKTPRTDPYAQKLYGFPASGIKGKTIEEVLAGTSANTSVLSKYFEELANAYQEVMWGGGARTYTLPNGRTIDLSKQVSQHDQPFWAKRGTRLNTKGFDIVIIYGDPTPGIEKGALGRPGTVRTIAGVQITGVSQVIDPSGDAVYEDYLFQAKDVDAVVNTTE